jgi:adenosylmethionine-8-amino-7-oxononanoate aminotransferase
MQLAEKDLKYVWHPYTHQKNRLPPLPIVKAKKAFLYDENDNEYIDAISSWWVNLHGHSHPYIAKRIYKQAKVLEQVIFTGFTHYPAVKLAEQLISLLPKNFSKIFYNDDGSTSVEVAIKIALQFWKNGGELKRNKILAFNHSYHGDTFGAMSVSSRSMFTMAFNDKLFEIIFIDTPDTNNLSFIKSEISRHQNEIACFIYEPLLQGAGGMKMYDGNIFNELLSFIKEKDIICIADEVLTGFYRTGKFFASDYLHIKPDIICLSKGLTGGTMALGVTACTIDIYNGFVSDDKTKTFFHGHSFTANPLACTAALASLALLKKKNCLKKIDKIIERTTKFLYRLKTANYKLQIKNARQLGTVLAFEIVSPEGDQYLNSINTQFTKFCLSHGVYLRPLGNTIYVLPPYCITNKQIKKVFGIIEQFLNTE